ncbi:MAG: hypothetical protein M0R06_16735 [Sphaerochaeta sp.]|jgi:hypothetical protein|nr:hypothetical protein [Sphaerochaeta sp.]
MSEYVNAKVYLKQGSTELVVASGGVVNFESGGIGKVNDEEFVSTGGRTITKQNYASSTGSTSGSLANHGIHIIGCTCEGGASYNLADPVPGRTVKIVCIAAGTSYVNGVITGSSGINIWIDGLSSGHAVKWSADPGYAVLDAYSTALWYVTSKSTTVEGSTSTT